MKVWHIPLVSFVPYQPRLHLVLIKGSRQASTFVVLAKMPANMLIHPRFATASTTGKRPSAKGPTTGDSTRPTRSSARMREKKQREPSKEETTEEVVSRFFDPSLQKLLIDMATAHKVLAKT